MNSKGSLKLVAVLLLATSHSTVFSAAGGSRDGFEAPRAVAPVAAPAAPVVAPAAPEVVAVAAPVPAFPAVATSISFTPEALNVRKESRWNGSEGNITVVVKPDDTEETRELTSDEKLLIEIKKSLDKFGVQGNGVNHISTYLDPGQRFTLNIPAGTFVEGVDVDPARNTSELDVVLKRAFFPPLRIIDRFLRSFSTRQIYLATVGNDENAKKLFNVLKMLGVVSVDESRGSRTPGQVNLGANPDNPITFNFAPGELEEGEAAVIARYGEQIKDSALGAIHADTHRAHALKEAMGDEHPGEKRRGDDGVRDHLHETVDRAVRHIGEKEEALAAHKATIEKHQADITRHRAELEKHQAFLTASEEELANQKAAAEEVQRVYEAEGEDFRSFRKKNYAEMDEEEIKEKELLAQLKQVKGTDHPEATASVQALTEQVADVRARIAAKEGELERANAEIAWHNAVVAEISAAIAAK
ncbi:MAG: hypothetical protein WCJ92_07410 [Alphaproteobacteria bacterium]